MRVMVMVKATPQSETGELPSQELMAAMGKFNQELVAAGIMKAGEGLKPSSEAVRVHFSGADRTVSDGPFAETKELVAGYWLWEVKSMAEAIEWVKRCPNPMQEDSDIDIRPMFEMADFADVDPSGEVACQEGALRSVVAAQGATTQPYLFFAGRCEEALDFYKQALGAQVTMVMRYNESPDPTPEGMLQPGFENKIMHAEFKVGNSTFLASDGCNDQTKFEGFRLAMSVDSIDACDRIFAALSDGGSVDLPLTKTFWSPRFGMLIDKFGVGWMLMVPGQQTCS